MSVTKNVQQGNAISTTIAFFAISKANPEIMNLAFVFVTRDILGYKDMEKTDQNAELTAKEILALTPLAMQQVAHMLADAQLETYLKEDIEILFRGCEQEIPDITMTKSEIAQELKALEEKTIGVKEGAVA